MPRPHDAFTRMECELYTCGGVSCGWFQSDFLNDTVTYLASCVWINIVRVSTSTRVTKEER